MNRTALVFTALLTTIACAPPAPDATGDAETDAPSEADSGSPELADPPRSSEGAGFWTLDESAQCGHLRSAHHVRIDHGAVLEERLEMSDAAVTCEDRVDAQSLRLKARAFTIAALSAQEPVEACFDIREAAIAMAQAQSLDRPGGSCTLSIPLDDEGAAGPVSVHRSDPMRLGLVAWGLGDCDTVKDFDDLKRRLADAHVQAEDATDERFWSGPLSHGEITEAEGITLLRQATVDLLGDPGELSADVEAAAMSCDIALAPR